MDDTFDEEQTIMNEREKETKAIISLEHFKDPISCLSLRKVLTVKEGSHVSQAIKIMQDYKVGSILIVDTQNKVKGIMTERDVLFKVVSKHSDLSKIKVDEIMTKDPHCLMIGDTIAHVMQNMYVGGYRHVPIIDKEKRPISIISIRDIQEFILKFIPDEVLNISSIPYRGPKYREGA